MPPKSRSKPEVKNKRIVKSSGPNPPQQLNNVPSRLLDVYVVGTNCYGELGLGGLTKKAEMPRPILNSNLDSKNVGVVDITVGGVHAAALTRDNRILTWGVNDEGALGRDTTEENKEDSESESASVATSAESDDDEITLNLKESTPLPVDASHFPKGVVFRQLAATDSATFALTTDGDVYGWGTFRGSNGAIGFSPDSSKEQRTPALIPELQGIERIVAGSNHVLALTSTGTVQSWGCNEQNQLGRRRESRNRKTHPLTPDLVSLPIGIRDIGTGSYHSFAILKNGTVYAWGSNNFGQTGVSQGAGLNDSIIPYPTKVQGLQNHGVITSITGGKDHSIAVTEAGKCFVWGRVENKALGITLDEMNSRDVVYDKNNRARILRVPHILTGIDNKEPVICAAAGADHTFIITQSGLAYSWGFNSQGQAAQPGSDEIEKPTLVAGKHLVGKKLISAAASSQFSILVGEPDDHEKNLGRKSRK